MADKTFDGVVDIRGPKSPHDTTIKMKGGPGTLEMMDEAGDVTVLVTAKDGTLMVGAAGTRTLVADDGSAFLSNQASGDVIIRGKPGEGGLIRLSGSDNVIRLDDDEGGREVFLFEGRTALLTLGSSGNAGDIRLADTEGRGVIELLGGQGRCTIGTTDNPGVLWVKSADNEETVIISGSDGITLNDGSQIRLNDESGDGTIRLNGKTGNIKASGTIVGGADCAEDFDCLDAADLDPGTVMVIADNGSLKESNMAYDNRVAGVISGAGGLRPGIILGRETSSDDRLPVALSGKVYVKADAQFAPIEVGDLLTTAPTHGHAMKAKDQEKAFGAVLGKALSPLSESRGLIPALVALQ